MSTYGDSRDEYPHRSGRISDPPKFELNYLFDDDDEPTEVTVFPESDDYDISTNWITARLENTVGLDDCR